MVRKWKGKNEKTEKWKLKTADKISYFGQRRQKSTLILIQSQRIFYAKIGGKRAILTPFYEK